MDPKNWDGERRPWGDDQEGDPQIMVVAYTKEQFDAQVESWRAKGYKSLGKVVHIPASGGGRRHYRVPESWSLPMYQARPKD